MAVYEISGVQNRGRDVRVYSCALLFLVQFVCFPSNVVDDGLVGVGCSLEIIGHCSHHVRIAVTLLFVTDEFLLVPFDLSR